MKYEDSKVKGISKTTLWRRMKKYGIAKDLTIR